VSNHVGDARLDLNRTERIDLPEAVYCAGKTTEQCTQIVEELLQRSTDTVIATRITEQQWPALAALDPELIGMGIAAWRPRPPTNANVAVVAAGTSDLPIADECRVTLEALGHHVQSITDVGVAGLHRLTTALPEMAESNVVVALAGMEGALPTVLAGLIKQPIVAVPTSVGYGTSFEGITALLSMMSSCAPGISVVGIDNGYGAACASHRILGLRA
jgi:NCAIR mutase (PurE)-related protein